MNKDDQIKDLQEKVILAKKTFREIMMYCSMTPMLKDIGNLVKEALTEIDKEKVDE